MSKRLKTEGFIEKARSVHGYKYDYSLAEFKRTIDLIKIICPKHGIFEQIPHSHYKGYGCSDCGKERKSKKYTHTIEKFIKDAKDIHGNKYDYSNVNYINNKTKVEIICSLHGSFEQTPQNHKKGSGCIKCNGGGIVAKNSEEVILNFKNIHNDEYDYSKVNYVNNKKKIIIICEIHGEFKIRPINHLAGIGCSVCKKSKGEMLFLIFSKKITLYLKFKKNLIIVEAQKKIINYHLIFIY